MSDIKAHYDDKKSVAHAYLLTVAAKALMIDDLNESERVDTINGLANEADLKIKILKDEAMRLFSLRLHSFEGVQVIKRDRKGRRRPIRIRMDYFRDESSFLVWKPKSGWGFRTFSLLNLRSVEEIDESLKYVRLINSTRKLELHFSNMLELSACLLLMQSVQSSNTTSSA